MIRKLTRNEKSCSLGFSYAFERNGYKTLLTEDKFQQLSVEVNKLIYKLMQAQECPHCLFLQEKFCTGKERNDREYWLMTEVFVYLHGSDHCDFEKIMSIKNK